MGPRLSVLLFEAVRGLTPGWLRRRLPRRAKRWLRARALGYTPFDFDQLAFDPVAGPEDVYYCYRLLLGRLPDPDGWKTYEAAVRGRQMPVETLVADFLASPEFRRRGLGGEERRAEPVLVDLDDFRLYVFPDDFDVGRAIVVNRAYEPHVAGVLRRWLAPGHVFVDVGAHVGYFSLLAASIVGPSGRVLSVEPDQEACALLWSSAQLNGFLQVELYPFAVAEARRVFVLAGRGSHGTVVEWERPLARASAVAVALTLDELLRDAVRVDVIKMDIEGAEGRALVGAQRTLATHRPVLVTEVAPGALANVSRMSAEDYLGQLVDAGYELAVIEDDGSLLACGTDPRRVTRELGGHPSPRLELVARPRP